MQRLFKLPLPMAAGVCLFAVALVALTTPSQVDAFWANFFKHPLMTIRGKTPAPPTEPTTTTTTTTKAPLVQLSSGQSARAGPSPAGRSSDETTEVDNFEAKCFIERAAKLSESPELYFYSSATHSDQSLGCKVNTMITLNYTDSAGSDDQIQLRLDEDAMRRDLFESGAYNGSQPSYVLVHGFLSSWNGDNWMCNIKDLILNNSQANVFIVDWSGGAKPMLPLDYGQAVSNTRHVAKLVAGFVNQLNYMSSQEDSGHFHCIGHSLGAHICGFIGYAVKNLGRITGLDPAGPCFHSKSSSKAEARAATTGQLQSDKRRLSPESAQFVLALHTDTSLFGLDENCAHYDVYVNGGRKQPKCGSSSLTSRFNDLLHLNLEDSLNPNIVCAHSFAHRILTTFIDFVQFKARQLGALMGHKQTQGDVEKALSLEAQDQGFAAGDDDTCYPMAYECDDWFAFKSGECGFCLDQDTRCVYTGLSFQQFQRRRQTTDVEPAKRSLMKRPKRLTDDDKFNDEDEEPGDDINGLPVDPNKREAGNLTDRSTWGQHFMKTAEKAPTCTYHYQLIVAARRSQVAQISESKKYYYYLDLPLESSGLLNDSQGNRLHDRLIQLSHKVDIYSSAHKFLVNRFLLNLKRRSPSVQVPGGEDLEFYTALITFKQAPREQCQNGDTDGDTKSDKWQLCKPLRGIREARLWSSSELKLNAVQFVAINYMSGLDYEQRLRNSHLMYRDFREPIKSRDQLDESNRASIESLSPGRSSSGLVGRAASTGSCLLSMLDSSDAGKAATNFKCSRSGKELKFAIKLRPNRMRRSAQVN